MIQAEELPISGALGDYLKAIYVLSKSESHVRITDISMYLNISKASVNRAVNMLCEQGFLEHKLYGDIIITDKGCKVGAQIYERHNIVRRFLTGVLDIPEDAAEREANYIGRGVSQRTIDKIADLTEHIKA